jgi:molybdopterin synthase catalytic subunit
MSKILEHIRQNKQDSQRLTGLKYEQLEKLLEKAAELHQEKQEKSELKKVRIINAGGGRKPKLSVEDQIMLTLTYTNWSIYYDVNKLLIATLKLCYLNCMF